MTTEKFHDDINFYLYRVNYQFTVFNIFLLAEK